MNDALLKLIGASLFIAVMFSLLGFVIGYNSPQMQGVFNQINTTKTYETNLANAYNDTNNIMSQSNTGVFGALSNAAAYVVNFLYKTYLLIASFLLLLASVFSIAFQVVFLVLPMVFNIGGLGVLGAIASLIYSVAIGIITITIAIYILNFIRGVLNVI